MKNLFLILIFFVILDSCKNNNPKIRYYKEIETGKILDQASYNKLKQKLSNVVQSVKGKPELQEIFGDSIVSGDSIIKTFEFKIVMLSPQKKPTVFDMERTEKKFKMKKPLLSVKKLKSI